MHEARRAEYLELCDESALFVVEGERHRVDPMEEIPARRGRLAEAVADVRVLCWTVTVERADAPAAWTKVPPVLRERQ
jgi:hypothetical protein